MHAEPVLPMLVSLMQTQAGPEDSACFARHVGAEKACVAYKIRDCHL